MPGDNNESQNKLTSAEIGTSSDIAQTVRDAGLGKKEFKKTAPERKPKNPTGDPTIDRPPPCEGEPESDSCFLDGVQRSNMLADVRDAINRAEQNYRRAVDALKLQELLAKEEDPHWLVSVALDLLSMALLGALKTVTEKAGKGIAGVASAGVKTAVDVGKKNVARSLKSRDNNDFNAQREAILGYVKHLQNHADASFASIQRTVRIATDEELKMLRSAFGDPGAHSQNGYEQALTNKIEAFRKSGVSTIGRTGNPHATDGLNRDAPTSRDTRVIKVFYSSGHPTELRYQYASWHKVGGSTPPPEREAAFGTKTKAAFEGASEAAIRASFKLGSVVPAEFAELARAQQAEVWGTEDKTDYLIIDESDYPMPVYGPERYLRAFQNTKSDKTDKHQDAQASAKAPLPTATKPKPKPPQEMVHARKLDMGSASKPSPYDAVGKMASGH